MSPEERVNLALELTSSITSITLESIKKKYPHISNRRLVEIARERFQRGRRTRVYLQSPESLVLAKLRMIKATVPRERSQKDRDDLRSILANARINKSKIVSGARRDMTLGLLRELIPETSKRKPIATSSAKKAQARPSG